MSSGARAGARATKQIRPLQSPDSKSQIRATTTRRRHNFILLIDDLANKLLLSFNVTYIYVALPCQISIFHWARCAKLYRSLPGSDLS